MTSLAFENLAPKNLETSFVHAFPVICEDGDLRQKIQLVGCGAHTMDYRAAVDAVCGAAG